MEEKTRSYNFNHQVDMLPSPSVKPYYYFEGTDPTDLSKLDSDYMKRLVAKKNIGIDNIQNTVYVSPKIDGYRAILYHKIKLQVNRTKENMVYDANSCYIITRRGEYHEGLSIDIPIALKQTPFIFDIEIVEADVKGEFPDKFYVMDVLHIGVEMLQNENFEYRLQKLKYLNLGLGTFNFYKVPYELYNPDKSLTDITGLTDEKTDGVVFCFGKDWVRQPRKRYKLQDTIDFQILPMEGSRDKVGLGILINAKPLTGASRIINGRKYRGKQLYQQRVGIFTPQGQPQVVRCKRRGELQINGIYEFKYNLIERKFECVRRRFDKKKPNRLFVANFIFNEIIKKKSLINPFNMPSLTPTFLKKLVSQVACQNEEEEEKEEPDSSPDESPSSKPLSM